jgi:hypothetical protein
MYMNTFFLLVLKEKAFCSVTKLMSSNTFQLIGETRQFERYSPEEKMFVISSRIFNHLIQDRNKKD